jgi:phosphoribosyl-ATP pyrophosphohydrolase/phosphoribosyl-AMP cyclohydrolase
MLGYMNKEALSQTITSGKVTFYSRSKARLWTKGETTGNYLYLKKIEMDCDRDTLLAQVAPEGPTCHLGTTSCFGEEKYGLSFLQHLQEVISDRKHNRDQESYTSSLFDRGIDKIAQKVGEEAVEVVIASKNNNQRLFHEEVADLMFHLIVLLRERETDLQSVVDVLKERHH